MHTGIILLTWLIMAIIIIGGLIASGILSVHIEIERKDKHRDEDEDAEQE